MKKKITALILASLMALSLASCAASGSSSAGSSSESSEQSQAQSSQTDEETYTIGICQLLQHEALDAATQGFEDALTEKLGDKVTFEYENASNDSATCSIICNQFVSSHVDLIMANATPALQAAQTATDKIPVLGTSVTDYGTALDISDWTGVVGTNVTGTSDLAPLEDQAKMLQEFFPDAKNVGIFYCSAEPNSKYQSKVITEYLTQMGYTCKDYTFSDSNDVQSAITLAASECDVIYLPTDNTVASNTTIIDSVCRPAKVPIIAGEEGICKGAGVATLSISYYDLGYATGKMAYEILVNGADPSTMPVEYAPQVTKKYNPVICADLGITPPEGYEAIVMDDE